MGAWQEYLNCLGKFYYQSIEKKAEEQEQGLFSGKKLGEQGLCRQGWQPGLYFPLQGCVASTRRNFEKQKSLYNDQLLGNNRITRQEG